MDLGIDGRRALVLGASSGLGLAVARALSIEGAEVALSARRQDVLDQLADQLANARGFSAELSDATAVGELVDRVQSAFGGIDILILNGGGPPPAAAAALSGADIQHAVELLFLRQQQLVAAFLPGMRAQRWGRIIAIGSSAIQQPIDGLALSNIGRAALAAYLKSLSNEVAEDGVTVNVVLPGRIDTDRVRALDEIAARNTNDDARQIRERSQGAIPARRYGTVDEFAAVVAFLASSRSSYVTGEQIRCDGGMVRSY